MRGRTQVRAEKPAWYLAVISGSLLRTLDFVAARSAEYLGYLEKGQLPPARLTLTAFEEAFVLDGGEPALGTGVTEIGMNTGLEVLNSHPKPRSFTQHLPPTQRPHHVTGCQRGMNQ